MATNYGFAGARIVSDGLVLYLDAANPNSYNPSTPLLWRDISRNGNNGTLVNGPTFDSSNGGCIVLDGSNDYVVIGRIPFTGTSTASVTWGIWVSPASNENAGNIMSMSSNNPQGSWNMPPIAASSQRFRGRIWQNNFLNSLTTYTYNTWYYVVLVWRYSINSTDRGQFLYVNGELQAAQTNITYSASNTNNFLFLGQANPGADNTGSFAGRIGHFHVYGNKALSQAEITQNFEATRGRFGI